MAQGDAAGSVREPAVAQPQAPSGEWLLLQQHVDELRRAQEEVRQELHQGLQEVRREIGSLRSWMLGLLLLAILGLLAKLLVPGV
jgi:tetrahydromethanopterin S-methyltransferase subunit G